MKNYVTEQWHGKGKTEEDRYMADIERDLIEKHRARAAQSDKPEPEEGQPASSQE